MTAAFATVGELRVTRAEIVIPPSGPWSGNFSLDRDELLEGKITLTLGDLELVGTVSRGGTYVGAAAYRIVAGANGWGNELPAKHYQSPASVQLTTVLEEAARTVKETVRPGYAARSLGQHWVREKAPAKRLLNALLGKGGWYVAENGETVVGARASAPVTAQHDLLHVDTAEQSVELATESPAAFMPGGTLEIEGETVTLGKVTMSLEGAGMRVRGSSAGDDRHLDMMRKLIREEFPELVFAKLWEYRIVTQSGNKLDLQPIHQHYGLPELAGVPIRPGVPGAKATHKLSSLVVVGFVNADPSKPVVLAFEDPDGPGFLPDTIKLGDAVQAVLRHGEMVEITGVQAGAGVTGAIIKVFTGTAPALQPPPPIGASRVQA